MGIITYMYYFIIVNCVPETEETMCELGTSSFQESYAAFSQIDEVLNT